MLRRVIEQRDPVEAGCMRQMRKVYRRRMVKLGLWPDMPPLRVVAVNSGAIGRLRRVA